MDFKSYSIKFTSEAENNGFSESNIKLCLEYAEVLYSKKLPIIYNLTHLSKLTGFKKNYLIQAAVVSKHSEAYYRTYRIKKKNGSIRQINEPLPNLKNIQYWILDNILYQIKVSHYAKAYVKKRGLTNNLRFHRNKEKVLTLDIKNFFPSIKFDKIEYVFSSMGYSTTVSNYLAKLCCLNESLPQGAPTSPYLSNIVMMQIDQDIAVFCKEVGVNFTRYADDLVFSGSFDEALVIKFITEKLNTNGFEINTEKTKLMYRSERQIVTGVVVNNKIQLTKEKRKNLRQVFYYLKKYGFENHMSKLKVSKKNYINFLLGQVSFGLYLNPHDKNLIEFRIFLLDYIEKDLKGNDMIK